MNKSEDYPLGLTDSGKEIFIVFDVIDNRGTTVREALKEISKKLHAKLPHRTTITPVFRVGLELFREDPLVLTDERINEIIKKVGYGIPSSRVVELYRLYLLWKAYRHKEIVNIDLILSALREKRLKVWFLLLQHWDEGEIAEKLGVSLKDVQYNREEAEKELVSKTKEETKMEQSQSMLNLPPWVNQAQWEHLEGKEQRDELPGIDIITYPGGFGIRQQLEFFKGCFLDINPRSQSFWRPLDDENVMAQLHSHLRDKAFWEQAEGSEGFIKKAKECEALLDATRRKFTSAGKKLAERTSAAGPTPTASVTNEWARDVCHRALGRPLGLEDLLEYGQTSSELTSYSSILYRGPDVAKAKQKHKNL